MSAPRVHHISCATMCPPGRLFVEGEGSAFEAARMVAHCLLVEIGSKLLLVDTGLGRADMSEPVRRLGTMFVVAMRPELDFYQTAHSQVRALGYTPEDVTDIVVTHLDLDHAGGLSDFPAARVHIYASELTAMKEKRTSHEKMRYRAAHFSHDPKWAPHEVTGDLWFGFDAVRAIDGTEGDVFIVPLTGHTRGHAGVAVRASSGWLLHAGDAYFHHREMQEPPFCPAALRIFQREIAIDDQVRRANQERLRELVRDHSSEVNVFSAHDPVEFDRFIKPHAEEKPAPISGSPTSGSATA